MGRLLQALECCYFDRDTRTILREFLDRNDLEWEIYLYDIYSLVASLIITFTFHYTLYLIHNEWSRWLEKIRGNIKCFSTLSWSWRNYKCFVFLIFDILFSSCISTMFLLAFYKNWVSTQSPKSQKVWNEAMVWNSFI